MTTLRSLLTPRWALTLTTVGLIGALVATTPTSAQQHPEEGGLPHLEQRVEAVERNVGELNTTVVDQATDLTTLADRLLALESSVSSLQDQVNRLEGDMVALKDAVSRLETDVAALRDRVSSVEGTISNLQHEVGALQAIADALQTQLTSLNKLSTLSSGVKQLLSWVQFPEQDSERFSVTCPVGVPLQVMLWRNGEVPDSQFSIEGMEPIFSVPDPVSQPTALDVTAPGGVRVKLQTLDSVTPYALCLNVDGLTAMTPDLDTPLVP